VSDLHDLAAFYVVGALEPDEARTFEEHLSGCAACTAEVAQLSSGVEALARAAAEPAPPELKGRVLARIDASEQASATAEVIPLRRPAGRWLGAVAAVVVLVVAVTFSLRDPDPIAQVLAADDLATVEIRGSAVGTATFRYSDELDRGVFSSDRLEAVGDQQTYELWLIPAGGDPQPAGLFVPSGTGAVEVLVEGPIEPGVTLGLTIEPAGGSSQPTGDILFAEGL
jgi:anti-sigma-K factor RskA